MAKFPPLGRRGFGLSSIVTDFRARPAAEEAESCNQETMVVLQIESREALDCVEEVACLNGFDVLFVGPYDLTLSLGIIEQFDNPLFWSALDKVVNVCEQHGIAAGIQLAKMDLLREAKRRGARFLTYPSDMRVLSSGYKQALAELVGTAL